jgi:xanthine dehydrogenase accessory factor
MNSPLEDDGSPFAEPSTDRAAFYEQLVMLEREGIAFVLVVMVDALGSTPQDAGAKMLMTASGLHCGTVGGGRVEAAALQLGQELLTARSAQSRFLNWSLKKDIGMTCGGSVKLYFEPHPARSPWSIFIFGAGHVAQALLPVLLPLPCQITCCDTRAEWLDKLPRARNLRVLLHENPADLVPSLPDDAFLLCLTKGHHSDRPILQRALAERNFPFIGVIGSGAKAAILRREMIAQGLSAERAAQFHCPVGLDFGSNHPHEIALSIAAQLVAERDRIRAAPGSR